MLKSFSIAVSVLALDACQPNATENVNPATGPEASAASATSDANPLLAAWKGPYSGVPAFDGMSLDALEPAAEEAMTMTLTEIDAIVANTDAPTFENTLSELEKSGASLDRVFTCASIWGSNLSSPEFRKIQGVMAPRLAAFQSQITQNEALSSLHTKFANSVLADEEGYVTCLTGDQLGGLPKSFVKAAASAAEARGETGKYAVTNTRSPMAPFRCQMRGKFDLRTMDRAWCAVPHGHLRLCMIKAETDDLITSGAPL